MLMPQFLKKFNLHIDGIGFAGIIEEINMPLIDVITEEHRAGGMDSVIDVDMGLEKLTSEITLSGMAADVLKKAGLINGGSTPVTIRGAFKRDGNAVVPVKANGTVFFKTVDMGAWTVGAKTTLKLTVSWRSYILIVDSEEIFNINIEGGRRRIFGVEQVADELTAIGL